MTTRKKTADSSVSFEQALERLEEIVGALEKGDAPLEKGLGLFEEGVGLSRQCHSMLETAEGRIRKLVKEEGGGVTLELFPGQGEEEE